ncbi:MAG TPA: hypothetical protein VFV50_01930, partial [Bdellovibrionales bacterium]|nr:hypothetical protein [Bdellovibrionales bacterium]
MNALVFLLLFALTVACSTLGGKRPEKLEVDRPIVLELSGSLSRVESIRYHFASKKVSKTGNEQPETKNERVDFTVQTTTKEVFPGGEVNYIIETKRREGDVPLHDLAFPEPGEKLEQILTRNARVLKAGEYSPDSIFYLPPIPLPVEPVKVGETWALK